MTYPHNKANEISAIDGASFVILLLSCCNEISHLLLCCFNWLLARLGNTSSQIAAQSLWDVNNIQALSLKISRSQMLNRCGLDGGDDPIEPLDRVYEQARHLIQAKAPAGNPSWSTSRQS